MPSDLAKQMIDNAVSRKIVRAQEMAAFADEMMTDAVAYCRAAGWSWARIGQELGTTRQAAWQRFSGKVEE